MKNPFPLEHIGDGELLSHNEAIWRRRRHCTAEGLAHLAEIDGRKLYLPSAYDTMQTFCIHELRFTPDEAEKRVTAARVARHYPVIFTLIAEGQLHLTGVLILSRWLAPENAEELLAAAADKTLREIRLLLAQRFPRPDLPIQEPPSGDQLDLAASQSPAPERVSERIPDEIAQGCVDTPAARAKLMPLAPGRFGVQFTMSQSARDHYEYARALLSHQLPQADLALVTEMALAALVEKLEKRKFGATRRPRSGARSAADPRSVPAAVRRQVLERDGARCTFTSPAGKRCPATRFLEYDHVEEVARGGEATVDNLRIRCRAHNQYAAELAFGRGFMDHKRREAKERTAGGRPRVGSPPAPERAESRAPGPRARAQRPHARADAGTNGHARVHEATTDDRDVTPWLRGLGVGASDARRMAEICETTMPEASLEERLKRALSYLAPRQRAAAAS